MVQRRVGWCAGLIVLVVAAGCAGTGASGRHARPTHVRTAGPIAAREPATTPAPTAPTAPPAAVVAPVVTPAPTPVPTPVVPPAPSVTIAAVKHGSARLNDNEPCSSISSQSLEVGELRVARTGPTDAALVVAYRVSGNRADYQPLAGRVTIPAGATSAAIDVQPKLPDAPAPIHVHRSSPVTVTLDDGASYDPGSSAAATIALRFDVDLFGCPATP